MACFHPLRAFKVPGGVSFSERDDGPEMWLPCGQCDGCKLERSRQWAIRCVHEAKTHALNCAVTLTYSNANLPPGGSLHYPHFQRFLKYLRKKIAPVRVRYFGCGEYGEKLLRPHFHACLFGIDFLDKKPFKTTDAGTQIFRSAVLEELWPLGHSSVGEMNFKTAAYVARYCVQKLTGSVARRHYQRVDRETGEVTVLLPEFNFMSLKPGIGARWLDQYGATDVFPHDRVVLDGFESKPPRYYDKRLAVLDPVAWKEVKYSREDRALLNRVDSTWRRLEAREVVAAAQLKRLRRRE